MKEIPVRYRGSIVAVTFVDNEDFEWLTQWTWRTAYVHALTDEWAYAYRSHRLGQYAMARQIMGLAHGDPRIVHHANEVRLDNRRCNLEVFESQSAHIAQAGHIKRPLLLRCTQRPHIAKTIPWSSELFEESYADRWDVA